MRPLGVFTKTPRESGILCTVLKNPTEKFFVDILVSSLISTILQAFVSFLSSNFLLINAAANLGA
ncbi:hypothetical protein SDC9_186092 [bioreactor metagenome]|uniref:Uncharacterized protein n=1 Tax=bioreactor metagenome TaxID=1076179 RepID=A0A645HHQ3_9ZZZZ